MHHFFVDPSSIEEGIVRIVGTDLNHMKNVLRMKPGEEVLISDGTGKDYNCQVKEYGAEEGILVILSENADSRELPSRIWLFQGLPKSDKMEVILQKPELPTGCESVALTMVLKQKGYPIEKTTIAEEYLIYNRDNYASGYVGDPSTYGGVGIYPPGLVNTANRFLKQRYQQHTAYDVSKLSLEELFPYVAAGNPVLLWLTSDLEDPYFSSQSVEYGGDSYRWYWNEHCVVLGGYNLEKQSVTLFDPLKGKVEESLERVEEIYDQTGKYAMTEY